MVEIWLIIALTSLSTFGTRLSLIALSDRWIPPAIFQHVLRYVPSAVLSAIIMPDMFFKMSIYLYRWQILV